MCDLMFEIEYNLESCKVGSKSYLYHRAVYKRIKQLKAEQEKQNKFIRELKEDITRLNNELEEGYKNLRDWSKESKEKNQKLRTVIKEASSLCIKKEKAFEILKGIHISKDYYELNDVSTYLDGNFTAEELRAVVFIMENKMTADMNSMIREFFKKLRESL